MKIAPASKWITLDAERILYVSRGRDTILCTMPEFPKGATLVLRVAAEHADQQSAPEKS